MNSSAVAKLAQHISSGTVNHAYIVVSPSGDMSALLRQCAKLLLCSDGGCNHCNTCNKVDRQVHNDCIQLPADPAKNRLSVDDISYLIEESYKRPVDNSRCRVFAIDATNSINSANSTVWQNKLLKTLEEPVGDVHILIGVRSQQGVLPTVLSRCQLLVQQGTGYVDTYNKLCGAGLKRDIACLAATLSQGNIDSANTIVADPSYYATYELVVDMLCHMTSIANSLTYVSRILSQDSYKDKILTVLTAVLREAIVCRIDNSLTTLDIPMSQLKSICDNYTVGACSGIIEIINNANKQLSNSGNYTVIIDKLIANMLEERYRCRI